MAHLFPPVDSAETVEIAPGVLIPANRYDELMAFIACNAEVAEAIAEIHLEHEFTAENDPLTDEVSTVVPFQFQSELEWKLCDLLMKQSNKHLLQAKAVHSVASFALSYK